VINASGEWITAMIRRPGGSPPTFQKRDTGLKEIEFSLYPVQPPTLIPSLVIYNLLRAYNHLKIKLNTLYKGKTQDAIH
jgi:hypothetical protein